MWGLEKLGVADEIDRVFHYSDLSKFSIPDGLILSEHLTNFVVGFLVGS